MSGPYSRYHLSTACRIWIRHAGMDESPSRVVFGEPMVLVPKQPVST